MFSRLSTSPLGRRGTLTTPHGVIDTPFFMPVATGGAMRGIMLEDLEMLGAQILLCNAYHLHLQPGEAIVQDAGGLHDFIGWKKPILTDSGGFQVFSMRDNLSIGEDGVHFRSHRDGSSLFIGPKESIAIQHALGSDIIMCFDECPPSTAARDDIMKAVDRTIRWAKICKEEHSRSTKNTQLLFGIIQGGLERDLRQKCVEELIAIGFDGYAVGGLAVGESPEEMEGVLEALCPMLPADKPRYLMGVGRIEQMRRCMQLGIDMFDCVLPMREARHGTLYLSETERIRIDRATLLHDHSPIDPGSASPLSCTHSRSYLCHLLRNGERYGETIACMQNMGVTLRMMQNLRKEMELMSGVTSNGIPE